MSQAATCWGWRGLWRRKWTILGQTMNNWDLSSWAPGGDLKSQEIVNFVLRDPAAWAVQLKPFRNHIYDFYVISTDYVSAPWDTSTWGDHFTRRLGYQCLHSKPGPKPSTSALTNVWYFKTFLTGKSWTWLSPKNYGGSKKLNKILEFFCDIWSVYGIRMKYLS